MVALPDPPPEPSAAADLAAIGLVGSYIALGHDGIRLLPMQGGPALVLPVEGAGLARIEARRRELVWVEREGGHVQAPILPGNIEARRASPGDRAPLLGPRSWSPRTSEAPGAWSVEIWLDPPAGSLVDRYQRERGAFPRWFVRVRRAGEVVLRRRFQRLFHRPTLLRGHLVGSGVAPDLGSADPVVFAIPVAGHV